ncbi:hypothetical protein [Aquimarina agarivorans]|uniref:hypothetical protein n=1 Tax=Aquimarina agarivorans TaxID=980584 RepID=UPI0002F0E89F|nr:hypothetical protein [Aquimarina agarivorans]
MSFSNIQFYYLNRFNKSSINLEHTNKELTNELEAILKNNDLQHPDTGAQSAPDNKIAS